MTVFTALHKPWHLCRAMGCRLKTKSGVPERDPTKRFCGRHMPRPRRWWLVNKCHRLQGPLCIGGADPALGSVSACTTLGVWCKERRLFLRCRSSLVLRCLVFVVPKKPPGPSPSMGDHVFLIKTSKGYVRETEPGVWTETVRRLATRFMGLDAREKAYAKLEELRRKRVRRSIREAIVVKYYFRKARKNAQKRPRFSVRVEGVFDRERVGRVCESARKLKLISEFEFEVDGRGVVVRGRDEVKAQEAVKAISHLILPLTGRLRRLEQVARIARVKLPKERS